VQTFRFCFVSGFDMITGQQREQLFQRHLRIADDGQRVMLERVESATLML
jgi:hypothetical protein